MVNKVYLNWKEVEELTSELATSIQQQCADIEYIHGLCRGGLIPAVMLSHKLGIPYTETPQFYGRKCLIVDDICDSGQTLAEWMGSALCPREGIVTAVLHYKPHTSSIKPTLWGKLHSTDDWIIYPWERQDSQTIQDYKLDK